MTTIPDSSWLGERFQLSLHSQPLKQRHVDMEEYVAVFHDWIRRSSLEDSGLLIDVASYAHVPNGPGVLLIGHELDYGVRIASGRIELTCRHKRDPHGTRNALQRCLRQLLQAARLLEGTTTLSEAPSFRASELVFRSNDRLRCPNTPEVSSRATRTVGALFCKVLGIQELVSANIAAEREALTLVIRRPAALGEPEELAGSMRRLASLLPSGLVFCVASMLMACAGNAAEVQPLDAVGVQAGAGASTVALPSVSTQQAATATPGSMSVHMPAPAAAASTAPVTAVTPASSAPASMPAPSHATSTPAQNANATTYQRDIRPIVEARCIGCHVAGGVGPFPLDSWDRVDMLKAVIVPAVMSRRMPPWPADDTDCVKQRNNQRLSDAQLALFAKWQADGFQQGDPSEFVPLVEEEPAPELGEPDLLITPQAYQLTANFEGYVCQQTDANLTEDVWVRALDVKPEHAEYVHHAIVNIGNGDCDALGLSAENLYSYRPGSRTIVFEEGDAMKLPAGQKIAIQFHYNTRGAPPVMSYPTDASPLRLWTLPKGQKPMRQIHRQPVHALNIAIPVGAVDHSVTASQAMQAGAGAEIIGISPHMHYLGQRFQQKLSGGGASDTCLVHVPDWDQSWQIDYLYKPSEFIKVMPGMTIRQECTYNNRPEDQGIGPDGKPYTPQYTTFGEDTRNEMCLGYVWYREPLR